MRWAPALEGDLPPRELVGVTPFPVVIGRIRRAVLSTGVLDSANRSLVSDAGVISCAFWLQRISLLARDYSAGYLFILKASTVSAFLGKE
jgi:hypothetical protein